jgi:hypothetical protein
MSCSDRNASASRRMIRDMSAKGMKVTDLDDPAAVRRALQTKTERHANGCWTWTGHKIDYDGYLIVKVRGQDDMWYAHRLTKLLQIGEIPEGVDVRRECGTPGCLNPDHRYLSSSRS